MRLTFYALVIAMLTLASCGTKQSSTVVECCQCRADSISLRENPFIIMPFSELVDTVYMAEHVNVFAQLDSVSRLESRYEGDLLFPENACLKDYHFQDRGVVLNLGDSIRFNEHFVFCNNILGEYHLALYVPKSAGATFRDESFVNSVKGELFNVEQLTDSLFLAEITFTEETKYGLNSSRDSIQQVLFKVTLDVSNLYPIFH